MDIRFYKQLLPNPDKLRDLILNPKLQLNDSRQSYDYLGNPYRKSDRQYYCLSFPYTGSNFEGFMTIDNQPLQFSHSAVLRKIHKHLFDVLHSRADLILNLPTFNFFCEPRSHSDDNNYYIVILTIPSYDQASDIAERISEQFDLPTDYIQISDYNHLPDLIHSHNLYKF